MTMIHARYDPGVVQRFLPPGFSPDLRDGSAWVSLTPFVLSRFRPPLAPAWDLFWTFPETNVRTYARDSSGRDGLVFLTLEASNPVVVAALRVAAGIPYRRAAMSVEIGETVRYRSTRPSPHGPVGHDIEVRPGVALGELAPDSLDHWLAGRWRSFSWLLGRIPAFTPVEHEPWPLHEAEMVRYEENLLASVGLPAPEEAPLVRYSPGVEVRIGAPRPGRRTSRSG